LKADLPVIAVTSGEPAGVGPELCLRLAPRDFPAQLVVLADRTLLEARAKAVGISGDRPQVARLDSGQPRSKVRSTSCISRFGRPSLPGRSARSGQRNYVLPARPRAGRLPSGEFAAMVTAPVHKGVINDAGVPFTGHTEYLAEKTNTPRSS
jgi:4-hydroxythreonine-4-phosphate dehydrogenase